MQSIHNETIAAIATPPGIGGISILRISGPDALSVLRSLFHPTAKTCHASTAADAIAETQKSFSFRPRYMHHGFVRDQHGVLLDEALFVYMPGPHSFTGEDVAEIHCHGGQGISAVILEAAQSAGVRIALPGEFSRRAFLNGRLDLTQAEAIAEMISAPGREGARLAAAKLQGALSQCIRSLLSALDAMRMQVILAVDFPDEDAELLSEEGFSQTLRQAASEIDRLLEAYERARLWREGALAVLAGRVNAGKSSLLNALLGRERAIVSASPGTTRDYVEESLNIQGIALRLCDTAGLRQGGDMIEEEGIHRAHTLAEEADILLFVSQAGTPLTDDEKEFLAKQEQRVRRGGLVILLNKIDLIDPAMLATPIFPDRQDVSGGFDTNRQNVPRPASHGNDVNSMAAQPQVGNEALRNLLEAMGFSEALRTCPCFPVSAKNGFGLGALVKGLYARLSGADQFGKHISSVPSLDLAPNLRQSALLRQAREELARMEESLADKLTPDMLCVHLDAAIVFLEEVTGSADNTELMDRIFADFCIGK